jgi:hypothetical protein
MTTKEMESDMIPELGDLLTIVSDLYGKTTGRIVYRDGRLIRIKPYQSSDRAIEFPLDEGTGLFKDAIGVTEIILHTKRRSPYFSKQLAVLPGTVLEFYTFDSKVAAEKGVVKSVIASGPNDYIELEDGRKLEFNFVGPPEPISVILPRAPDVTAENEAGVNTNSATGLIEGSEGAISGLDEDIVVDPDTVIAKDEDIEALDQSILPSSELEIIPVSELRYNDVVQLEDMNNDLISGLTIKMQKNRKIKRAFKNQAKSFLDLKNAIYNDGNGFLDYSPETLLETIKKQALYYSDRPLDYIIPISNMRRTIFIDDASFESQQLIGKNEVSVFVNSINAAKLFDSTSSSGAASSNKFATYMNTIFMNNNGIGSGAGEKSLNTKQTIIPQSVLRAPFPKQPQGLVRNLPSGRKAGTFGGAQKASDTKLNLNFIGKVNHSMYRVLPTMTVTNPKTKYSVQIAPPDFIDPMAYLLLPPSLSVYRSANTRSKVLVYDIQRSDLLTSNKNFIYQLYDNLGEVTIIRMNGSSEGGSNETDDIKLFELFEDYLPDNIILSYNDYEVFELIDGLGLEKLELNPSIVNVINQKIDSGISHYNYVLGKEYEKGMQAISKSSVPVVSNIVDGNSSFFTTIESEPELKQIVENVRSFESVLGGSDLVLVSEIEKVATENGRNLLYASLANSERPDIFKQIKKPEEDIENVDSIEEGTEGKEEKKQTKPSDLPPEPSGLVERIQDEMKREKRRQTIEKENKFVTFVHEEPVLNTCEHVDQLNAIYGIQNDAERFYLLEKFIQKYQYSISNNWITCNICKLNLVCRHEILMIEEFKNQLGSTVLHKALLLQFGEKGNFGTDYICKNCGQKIGELDFDSHIEFDDEGKPMIGRSIIDPSAGINPDELFSDLVASFKEGDLVQSLKPAEKNIYNLSRILFETAGATPNEIIYDKLVHNIYDYILANSNNEYAIQSSTYAKAKRSLKREVFDATYLLSVIAAFSITMFQIAEDDLVVNIPNPKCVFTRDGYPRDGDDPKTSGTGLVDYIVCTLANIDNEDSPWVDCIWSAETIGSSKRMNLIKYYVLLTLKNLRTLPFIGDALQKAKNDYDRRVVSGQMVGISKDDRLPPAFRPAPSLSGATDGVEAVPAFTNIEMFKKSVISDPIEIIKPLVDRRELILAQEVIEQFHDNAIKTVRERPGQSKRSDGHCCETLFETVEKNGLGIGSLETLNVSNEISVIRSAVKAIAIRDPVLPSAGTHFITPWSASSVEKKLIEPDSSVFFRLFFKACASGSNAGHPHEYGTDSICRRCRLYYPKNIPFITEKEAYLQSKVYEAEEKKDARRREHYETLLNKEIEKRNELYNKSLSDIGIVVSPESFGALQDAIRAVKHIIPSTSLPLHKPSYGYDMLSQLVKSSNALHSTYLDDWKALLDFIVNDSMLKEEAREIKFGNFVTKYDMLKSLFVMQYVSLGVNLKSQTMIANEQGNANKILNIIDQIVANDARAPRLLLTLFVVPTRQIVSKIKVEVNSANWFVNMTQRHRDDLNNYWKKHYASVQMILGKLEDDEEVDSVFRTAMDRLTAFLGPVFQTFNSYIRGDSLLTHPEVSFVLGWFLRSAFLAGFSESSGLYAGAPSVEKSIEACRLFREYLMSSLNYINARMKILDTPHDKIKMAIEDRKAVEREFFIREQEGMSKEEQWIDKVSKTLGIGRWAEGALKDNFKYDADYYEFHRSQRADYLPTFMDDLSNSKQPTKDDYGLDFIGKDSSVYSVGDTGGHYAKGAEDE